MQWKRCSTSREVNESSGNRSIDWMLRRCPKGIENDEDQKVGWFRKERKKNWR